MVDRVRGGWNDEEGGGFTIVAREEPHLTKEAAMKRAMVGILAVILLAAFASPVMARSPYSADWKAASSSSTDCGNVVVTYGGTLVTFIDLTYGSCYTTTSTFAVCRVLDGTPYFVVQILDDNPDDGKISLLEGTKIGVFGSGEAFDFLEVRDVVDSACTGTVRFTSGQPR